MYYRSELMKPLVLHVNGSDLCTSRLRFLRIPLGAEIVTLRLQRQLNS